MPLTGKKTFLGLLLGLSGCCPFGVVTACEIIVAWEPWPPFQMQLSDGTYTGLDLDILQAIDREMSVCSTKLVQRPWKRNLQEIQSGKVDLTPGVFKSPEREEFSIFSEPYRAETSYLYVSGKLGKKHSFNSVAEFIAQGFRLGTTRGYYYGREFDSAKANFSRVSHRAVTSESQLYEMFVRGRVDGFISTFFNARSGMETMKFSNYVPVLKIHSADRYFMISKQIAETKLTAFNSALATILKSGEVQRIIDEYQN